MNQETPRIAINEEEKIQEEDSSSEKDFSNCFDLDSNQKLKIINEYYDKCRSLYNEM